MENSGHSFTEGYSEGSEPIKLTENSEEWRAAPKPKKPLAERLDRLSDKIHKAQHAVRNEKDEVIGFVDFAIFHSIRKREESKFTDQLKQRDETIKQKDEEMKLRLAERGKTVDAWIQTSITQREEIKQLKEALKNLIPIAERTAITVDNVDWRTQWETKRKALETATKLLTK